MHTAAPSPHPDALSAQQARAALLQQLHRGPELLLVLNAWDAASARVFEAEGAHVVGTSSAGIAFSHGHRDDTRVPRQALLGSTGAIASAVQLPVTADILDGLGDTPEAVAATVREVIALGAVGVNIEDARDDGSLVDPGLHAEKLAAALDAARGCGVDIVVNARTDAFWLRLGDAEHCLQDSIARLRRYRQAGAQCLFVPGLVDAAGIRRVVEAVDAPLNILASAGCPDLATLQALGVRRVSLGSGPMRAAMGLTRRIARELLDHGHSPSLLQGAVPYDAANALFGPAPPSAPATP